MVMQGRISDVAAYCETDIVNTYGIWLYYQLFRGSLTLEQFVASKEALRSYLHSQSEKKPHLLQLLN
jgi:predicted PolB exonuclease-like 3'-5' exonuclease